MVRGEMMKTGFGLIVILIAVLTACTPEPSDAPEPDFDAVRTQAVQTAVMQITADAVLHPKMTPSPQSVTIMGEPSTSQPEKENGTGMENVEQTNLTPTSMDNEGYACEVEEDFQFPGDGPRRAGDTYAEVWRIRNAGSTSWKSDQIAAVWVGGAHLCTMDKIQLGWNVQSGESVEIRVPVRVPDAPSTTPLMMAWALVDGEGTIFCKFYHTIAVVE